MKRLLLAMLSIGAGFIVLGVAFLSVGGFKPIPTRFPLHLNTRSTVTVKKYDSPKTIQKQVDAASCSRIELDLVNTDLQVVKGDGNQITLSYDEAFENEWDYSFSGSALKLRFRKYYDNWIQDLIDSVNNWDEDRSVKPTVRLTLPENTDVTLKPNNVNGSTSIQDLHLNTLNAKGVNTDISVSNVTASSEMIFQNTNGGTHVSASAAPQLDIGIMVNSDCTVSNSDFPKITARGEVNGTIRLEGVKNPEDYAVDYETVNGSVNFNGDNYSGRGTINSASGKYKIDFQGVNCNLKVTAQS